MHVFTIRKGTKERTIYAPSPLERAHLNLMLHFVRKRQEEILLNHVHGFRPGRSPVTNALPHRNKDYTLSMDLKNFFDSVTKDHLKDYLPAAWLEEIENRGLLYKGAPRQGLPTSPFLANIAAHGIDERISYWLLPGMVYTRYADDLTISWNHYGLSAPNAAHNHTVAVVANIVREFGFELAKGKTHLQSAKAGRRVICGVAVDHEVHAPRHVRRRLRAAEHKALRYDAVNELHMALKNQQGKIYRLAHRQAQGLREWCAMKLPKGAK